MKKKNYKALKKKKENKKDIVFQILKWICLFGVGVLFVELIIFGIIVYKNHNNVINVDLSQNVIETSFGYVTVGSSNFSKSKFHDKTKSEIGVISLYKNDVITDEIQFTKYYQSGFYDLEEISSGYVVAGFIKKAKDENKEAVLLKFDKDWKIEWEKTYSELDVSMFRSLIVEGDYIYVVGSSVYEDDVIGNEDKGGAIVLKYDLSGNEIVSNHFGGNKNGAFYDIVKVNDIYYAVGSDTVDDALLIGFNSNLESIVVKNYADVNHVGFTSILASKNSLYVTCAKMKDENKQTVERATIVQYDYEGNVLKEEEYAKEDYSIWNKIIDYNGSLYLVGDSAIKEGKKGSIFVDYIYKGIISRYSYDLKQEWIKEYDYENNEYYKSCIGYKDKIYVVGYTNSDIKELNSSKNDYVSYIHKYNIDGTK